ncbi:putative transposase [Limosilactobacillus fermentum F-6]|nr:putative transposase [Limosilactobacillus fermentum F-6]
MKSMAKMKYHYGLKMRCYPSDQQKQLIKINSDASRFIYNEMVAINKELMQLRRVKLPIDIVQDRIKQLTMRQNAKQMSNHYQFLEDKRIDSLTKAKCHSELSKSLECFLGRFTPLAFPNFIERVITGGIKLIVNTRGKKLRC